MASLEDDSTYNKPVDDSNFFSINNGTIVTRSYQNETEDQGI